MGRGDALLAVRFEDATSLPASKLGWAAKKEEEDTLQGKRV